MAILLNYLYANFQEEAAFAESCDITPVELEELVENRLMPAASYVFKSSGQSTSFVSRQVEAAVYRFHLKGHRTWFENITRLGIAGEAGARGHFIVRYRAAREAFVASHLGKRLCSEAPAVVARFDKKHENQTWQRFLEGVYGVCTRDGQPETVFLKQAGVLFIEQMIRQDPGELSGRALDLLEEAVNLLDRVESDFAPHEVSQSSRKRCIVDVRAGILRGRAA